MLLGVILKGENSEIPAARRILLQTPASPMTPPFPLLADPLRCSKKIHHTAVSAGSPAPTTGTLSPRSGDCRTSCSCLLALKKSLTARIKMNQPTIISTYANQSLLAILEIVLDVVGESCDAAMAAAAAAVVAASLDTWEGSKSWLFGSGGGVNWES